MCQNETKIGALVAKAKGNPFREPSAFRSAAARLLEMEHEALRTHGSRGEEEARTLLLAWGHAQSICAQTPPERLLLEPDLPSAVWREARWSRDACLGVVLAAQRCYRALERLAGRSEAVRALRETTWRATFGQSLVEASRMARLIHDHDLLITGETGTGKEIVAMAGG